MAQRQVQQEDVTNLKAEDETEDDRLRTASIPAEVKDRRDWGSLLVIYFATFVGDACRGVFGPVLWPLCQHLGGSVIDLGYLVSIFSVGRMVVSTRVGIISDQRGHRTALLLSSVIVILGGVLWANVGLCGGSMTQLVALYAAQFILGLGTGSLGVTRSYVVDTTLPVDRTHKLAQLSALQYAGFSTTSVIGASLESLGADISPFWKYSLPAYIIIAMGLLNSLLLVCPFKDIARTPLPPQSTPSVQSLQSLQDTPLKDDVDASEQEKAQEKKIESIAALMIFLNFSTRGVVAIYETQMVQTLLDVYNISALQAGTIITLGGVLGTLQFLFYKYIWQRQPGNEIHLIIFGIVVSGLAQIFLIDWGPVQDRGLWTYIVAILLVYGIGYPVSNSAALGVFSNLPKKAKGKAQGRFALAGSAARVLMPIVSGYLENFERTASFSLALAILGLSLFGVAYYYEEIQALCPSAPPGYARLPSEHGSEHAPLERDFWKTATIWAWQGLGLCMIVAGIGCTTDWGGNELWGWEN